MLNRKTLFAIAISLALLLSPLIHPLAPRPAQAATLLSETFQNATAPNWTFGGNPNPPVLTASTIDPAGQGWLRLTTSDQNQTGFVFNDLPVPSTNGFVINFDFAVFGGSGADGFTFFLMDGTVPAPYPGAFGGSLGYAQRETGALPADPDVLGLSQGYVGIGFDEWGNYSNDNEGRQGGHCTPTGSPFAAPMIRPTPCSAITMWRTAASCPTHWRSPAHRPDKTTRTRPAWTTGTPRSSSRPPA
jgi:hypothetical protein